MSKSSGWNTLIKMKKGDPTQEGNFLYAAQEFS